MAAILCGSHHIARKRTDEDLGRMVRALRDYQATGSRHFLSYWLALLAKAFADADRHVDALAALAEAEECVERTDQRWTYAELHRLRAGVLLRARPAATADAEAALRNAIAVARQQAARMWELRAARDLARLWAERGEHRRAHDLLAPVYGWFGEGFGTPDLQEAGALLDALR
jgi:predicted ATPase